jgi:putative transposase
MFENPRGHKTVHTLGYTLAQVGEYFGVSYATVSQAVKQAENRMGSVKCKA